MEKLPNIVIVGSTGSVGIELVNLLEERKVKFIYIKLIANNSAGKIQIINNIKYTVRRLNNESFLGMNYAIFACDSETSKKYAPIAVKSGCIVIDNSSAFRMDPETPLVIPEINFTKETKSGIIANPNCSTILLLMVIAPLHKINKIKKIDVSTYQAASGAGIQGINELESQVDAYIKKYQANTSVFGRQYLFNAFSHNSPIDKESKYNEEEIKMIKETHKILDENIIVNPTCIRIPTFRSHLETVNIEFENDTDTETIIDILNKSPGVKVDEDYEKEIFPEPIRTTHQYDVFVGRIRQSYHKDKKNYQLILSGDQILKGAALNAIQILEKFIEN